MKKVSIMEKITNNTKISQCSLYTKSSCYESRLNATGVVGPTTVTHSRMMLLTKLFSSTSTSGTTAAGLLSMAAVLAAVVATAGAKTSSSCSSCRRLSARRSSGQLLTGDPAAEYMPLPPLE